MADFYFRVHRSELLPGLNAVLEAVDGKAKISILSNVLLRVEDGQLLMRGTNLDLEIEATCDVLEIGTGEPISVKGSDLRDIVRNLPETAEIEFRPGRYPGQVSVRAGRSSFSIFFLPANDFPSISSHVQGESFEIEMPALSDALKKVLFAVDRSATGRAFYEGVYINPIDDGNGLHVVGAEGRTIAVICIKTRTRADFKGVILPLKTVMSLRKLLGDSKQPAHLTISDQMIRIICSGITILSKLIDAIFPQNYQQIMAVGGERKLVADVAAVKASTARVLLVSTELRTDGVSISFEGGAMRLEMVNQQGENAIDFVPVDCEGAIDFSLGLNGVLMAGVLDSIETQDVNISISGPRAPALFRPSNDAAEYYVIAPMAPRGAE